MSLKPPVKKSRWKTIDEWLYRILIIVLIAVMLYLLMRGSYARG